MNKNIVILAVLLIASACANQSEKNESSANDTEIQEVSILAIDEVFASPDKYIDQEISVRGMVTHVCKHGGQKLFIATQDNPESLRINSSESIPEFSLDLEGSTIIFTGTLMQMNEELSENFAAEEEEHHHDDDDYHSEEKENRNMDYYLIAKSFKTID